MSSRGSTPARDADIGTLERAASPGVRLQPERISVLWDTRLRTEVREQDREFLWSGISVQTQTERGRQKTSEVLLQSSWSRFPTYTDEIMDSLLTAAVRGDASGLDAWWPWRACLSVSRVSLKVCGFVFQASRLAFHSGGFSRGHQRSAARVPHQTPDLLRWSLTGAKRAWNRELRQNWRD